MPHEHLPIREAQDGPHHCTQAPPEIGPLPAASPRGPLLVPWQVVTAPVTTCQAPLDALCLYSSSQQPWEVGTAIIHTVQGGTGPERLGLRPGFPSWESGACRCALNNQHGPQPSLSAP